MPLASSYFIPWAANNRRKTQAEVAIRDGEAREAYEAYLGQNPPVRENESTSSGEEEHKEGDDDGNDESEEGPTTERNKTQAVRSEVWAYPGIFRIDQSLLCGLQ